MGGGELKDQIAPLGQNALDYPVAVLTAEQTKGLEFDTVIIAEPSDIFASEVPNSERRAAAADLYVAMTRPTTKLCLVHRRPLPPGEWG